jgi:predicted nucleic acid-binding protein
VQSLDTNILLSYALADHPQLSLRAKALIEGQHCHVPLLALAEFGFVMASLYEVKPPDLTQAVRRLMQTPTLHFENESRVLQALAGVEAGVDWFDAMLWASVPVKGSLVTMDKKFANKAAKLSWQPSVAVVG